MIYIGLLTYAPSHIYNLMVKINKLFNFLNYQNKLENPIHAHFYNKFLIEGKYFRLNNLFRHMYLFKKNISISLMFRNISYFLPEKVELKNIRTEFNFSSGN